LNPENGSSIHIKKENSENASIDSNTIYSLFRDESGIMWVGTNGTGLYKHNSRKRDYTYLEEGKDSISHGKVEAIVEDAKGNLWIGVYNGGLNYYNKENNLVSIYKNKKNNIYSLSNDIINDLLLDSQGELWISTMEGLNKFDSARKQFERISIISDKNEDIHIEPTYTELYEDRSGYLWVGSHNFGLYRYDRVTGEIISYSYREDDETTISDHLVNTILERENGEFWIGTNKGLNLLDRESGRFKRYLLDRENPTGINNNSVRALLEDSRGKLWIGTGGGGINIYDDETDQFTHITTREGLSNNFIMSMEEDASGNIWAGSKYGISIINTETNTVRIMDKEDGIQSMEFTKGSLKGEDNSIYMGSIGLVNKFYMDSFENKKTYMDLHIKSIELGGEEYSEFSLYNPEEDLILDYKDSDYIAFEFVALNYQSPSTINYAHKLEGFDNQWIEDKNRRFAIYTNIPPGEYTFQVKAANTEGNWYKKITEQKIIIKPPLWRTWWAYSFYLIVFSSFIFLLISVRTSFLRKQQISGLEDAESYLSDILNSMPSILIGIDENLIITQWNKEAENNTLKSEAEAKGRKLDQIFSDLPLSAYDIKNSIHSDKIISKTKRKKSENNEVFFEVVTIYPLKNGNRKEAVIRIDDVTKQIRMEEILIQSEKMLSVGGLAAGMAHEINNPLAGMIQSASVLSNRLWKGLTSRPNIKAAEKSKIDIDAIQKYMEEREIPRIVDSINSSGKRIAEIVENMLSFAHKDNSVFTTENISILLDKTLELAAADYDLKKQYDFKDIKIIKEIKDNTLLIPCERSKIQQVILNILRNGAEAMSESRIENPQFTFRIYCERDKKSAVLEIEDNGPGIDIELRKRIFEPFFTTKPVGVGTGLGLSISYFIITENHNGEIEIESEPGRGARFIIKLPLGN